jgi:hypothetical protein
MKGKDGMVAFHASPCHISSLCICAIFLHWGHVLACTPGWACKGKGKSG